MDKKSNHNQPDGRRYLPNGQPVFKERTLEEKQKYCRSFSHYGIRSDLMWGEIYEWGCHTPDCPKCIKNRKEWRTRKLYGRLRETGADTFYTKIINNDESKSLRSLLRKKGTEFISIPVPEGKLIITENFLDGFSPVEKNDMLASIFSIEIVSGKESRISGKLGLVKSKKKVLIPIVTRGIGKIKSNKILSKKMFSKVSTLAMISVGGIDAREITPDMLQTLVAARENRTVDLLKRMGYSVYLKSGKEVMVDPEIIKDRWIEIEIKVTTKGNTSLLDGSGREIISEAVDRLSGVADDPMELFRDVINSIPPDEALDLMDEFALLGVA